MSSAPPEEPEIQPNLWRVVAWVLVAFSVLFVVVNAIEAQPFPLRDVWLFVVAPLPGLAAALLADRRGVRWPLGVLGGVYFVGWMLLFMLLLALVGLLWMLAAGSFPKRRARAG